MCVNEAFPRARIAMCSFTSRRFSSRILAGRLRTVVAVGRSRLATMFATILPATPDRTSYSASGSSSAGAPVVGGVGGVGGVAGVAEVAGVDAVDGVAGAGAAETAGAAFSPASRSKIWRQESSTLSGSSFQSSCSSCT